MWFLLLIISLYLALLNAAAHVRQKKRIAWPGAAASGYSDAVAITNG